MPFVDGTAKVTNKPGSLEQPNQNLGLPIDNETTKVTNELGSLKLPNQNVASMQQQKSATDKLVEQASGGTFNHGLENKSKTKIAGNMPPFYGYTSDNRYPKKPPVT